MACKQLSPDGLLISDSLHKKITLLLVRHSRNRFLRKFIVFIAYATSPNLSESQENGSCLENSSAQRSHADAAG